MHSTLTYSTLFYKQKEISSVHGTHWNMLFSLENSLLFQNSMFKIIKFNDLAVLATDYWHCFKCFLDEITNVNTFTVIDWCQQNSGELCCRLQHQSSNQLRKLVGEKKWCKHQSCQWQNNLILVVSKAEQKRCHLLISQCSWIVLNSQKLLIAGIISI